MDTVKSRLEQGQLGEKRFNPDEQRRFLGTYRERVVLTIAFDQATLPEVKATFTNILPDLISQYANLEAHLSGNLGPEITNFYTKTIQDQGLNTSIVSERTRMMPLFALVICSDTALNLPDIAIDHYLTTDSTLDSNTEDHRQPNILQRLISWFKRQ